MKTFTLFMLLVALLAGCSLGTKPQNPANIETSVGQEFKVVVPSNPSTGYHWEIVGQLDKNIVDFVARDYRQEGTPMPGSGGSDVFTFKAMGAGQTEITLGYYPPSNTPVDPQETKTFTVVVK